MINQVNINVFEFVLLGFDLPGALFATILPHRCGELHQNGFIQSGNGFCAELLALHLRRSESDIRECTQRDGFHAHTHTTYGHNACGESNLNARRAPNVNK